MLKPVENLMSYDEHKVWLSTRRGQLKTSLQEDDGTVVHEREQNLLIELGNSDDFHRFD